MEDKGSAHNSQLVSFSIPLAYGDEGDSGDDKMQHPLAVSEVILSLL